MSTTRGEHNSQLASLNAAKQGRARLVGAALTALIVFCGLGACSKEETNAPPAPQTSNTAPTNSTADETTEPAPQDEVVDEPVASPAPEEPEAMKTGDKAGALAATEFFIKVIEHDMVNNSTDLLDEYAFEGCGRCEYLRGVAKNQEEMMIDVSEYTFTELEISAPEFTGDTTLLWDVPVKATVKSSTSDSPDTPPVKQNTPVDLVFLVGFSESSWKLVEIEDPK
ncbi:DUF6318 family protein [Jonesia quinghaiensis]|uniref:DUF6318 family protein n=1 Tax=Jonesia quinghaiensis TaxID=262806 RepID=UPI00041A41CC|nr:DUF6318 family protein [Jonesia quinghaiensis]